MSNEINEDLVNAREELQEINDYLEDLKDNFDLSDYIDERELKEQTIETLNQVFGSIKIVDLEIEAGEILNEMYPAYFEGAYKSDVYHKNEEIVYDLENNDYSIIYDVVDGLEDKIDRKEELVDIIQELEEELTQDRKSTIKP